MTFSDSVKTCLSKFATFSGPATRSEYWWFILFVFIISAILSLAENALFGVDPTDPSLNRILSSLFSLAVFLPMLAVGWRRMHVIGKPGRYLLIPMLKTIATFVFVMMGVLTFAGFENAGADPQNLRGLAALFGMTGIVLVSILQVILVVLPLWWVTRPSEAGEMCAGPLQTKVEIGSKLKGNCGP